LIMRSTMSTSGTDPFEPRSVSSGLLSSRGSLPTTIHRTMAALGMSIMILGCQSLTSPTSILLRIEPLQTQYAPGDTLSATFRNVGTEPVSLNPCYSALQRHDEGRWVDVQQVNPGPSVNCPDILLTQPVGATATYVVGVLPAPLGSGTYRYRIDAVVSDVGAHSAVQVPLSARVSSPFLVANSGT